MSRRFLSSASIGIITAIAGVFLFASSAFAAATIESVKLTGPNTITIIYSEPVYTSPADYSNFTGSFNGYSVNSVGGSGSSVVTLGLSGSPLPGGANGYVTIGTTVQDVSDSQYFQGGTWNIIDAVGPEVTSFGMSSSENDGTFAGTNDTVTVNFDTNEQVTVQSMTIAGHSVSVSGGGEGPYSASYTMQSGDTQQSVPVSMILVDASNDQTRVSFSFNANGTAATTSVAPTLSQVAPVPSTVSTANPVYSFYTTEAGSIEYGGGCTSPTTAAILGTNTVTFNSLGNGTYNCTVSVIDGSGNMSNTLSLPTFTVDATNGSTATTAVTVTAASSSLAAQIAALQSQLSSLETQSGGTAASSAGTTTSYQFTAFLGIGSEGTGVTALQERLTADGLFTGPITGYYGSLTQAAVEKYQSAHGIAVKGYVGPNTRAALNAGD